MKKLLGVLPAILLTGCASPNVPLKASFWKNHKQKVAVTTTTPMQAGLYQEGDQGLVDYIISSGVAHSFRDYLRGYRLTSLKQRLAKGFLSGMASRHVNAHQITPINLDKLARSGLDKKSYSTVDVRPLKFKVGGDKLLFVDPIQIGATRKYLAFVPVGAPKAICELEGDLVNVNNNKLLWRYKSRAVVPVSGSWDQPPRYPHFTQALQKATQLCSKELIDNFLYAGNS